MIRIGRTGNCKKNSDGQQVDSPAEKFQSLILRTLDSNHHEKVMKPFFKRKKQPGICCSKQDKTVAGRQALILNKYWT